MPQSNMRPVNGGTSVPRYAQSDKYQAMISCMQVMDIFDALSIAVATCHLKIPVGTIMGRIAEFHNIGAIVPLVVDDEGGHLRKQYNPRRMLEQNPSLRGYCFWKAETLEPGEGPPTRCRKDVYRKGPGWEDMVGEWAASFRVVNGHNRRRRR